MSLLFPVALWLAPPRHPITAMCLSHDNRLVVTGSTTGALFYWSVQRDAGKLALDEAALEPKMMLLGHRTRVTAISMCVYEGAEAVLSVSLDGSVYLWNLTDGRCLASATALLCAPTCVAVLWRRRVVAVAGQHSSIEIVDMSNQEITMSIDGHTNWVVDLCSWEITTAKEGERMLVSISLDGTMCGWVLVDEDTYSRKFNVPLGADGHTRTPICLSRTRGGGVVLVLCKECAMLFTDMELEPRLLLTLPASASAAWKFGRLVSHHRLVLWDVHGRACVFALPSEQDLGDGECLGVITRLGETLPDEDSAGARDTPQDGAGGGGGGGGGGGKGVFGSDDFWSTAVPSSPSTDAGDLGKPSMSPLSPPGPTVRDTTTPTPTTTAGNTTTTTTTTTTNAAAVPDASGDGAGANGDYVVVDYDNEAAAAVESATIEVWLKKLTPSGMQKRLRPKTQRRRTPVQLLFHVRGGVNAGAGTQLPTPTPLPVLPGGDSDADSVATPTFTPGPAPAPQLSSSHHVAVGCWGTLLAEGSDEGRVCVWLLPEESSSVTVTQDLNLYATATVSDGWMSGCIPPNMCGEDGAEPRITATEMVEDNGVPDRFVLGLETGDIYVCVLPYDNTPSRLQGHTAQVNQLMAVPMHVGTPRERTLLLSASHDATVRVWDAHEGHMLHVFHHHSSSVTTLLRPALHAVYDLSTRFFCSVSSDNSVAVCTLDKLQLVYLLGGHSSAVEDIYWNLATDHLIVVCERGDAYLWQLSTGMLERVMRVEDASKLIAAAVSTFSRGGQRVGTRYSGNVARHKKTAAAAAADASAVAAATAAAASNHTAPSTPRADTGDATAAAGNSTDLVPSTPGATSGDAGAGAAGQAVAAAAAAGSSVAPGTPPAGKKKAAKRCIETCTITVTDEDPDVQVLLIRVKTLAADLHRKLQASNRRANPNVAHDDAAERAHTPLTPSLFEGSNVVPVEDRPYEGFPYSALTYLLSWGMDATLDQQCIDVLHVQPPQPATSYAVVGYSGVISLLVPKASRGAERWRHSPHVTALHAMCSLAIYKSLMVLLEQQNMFSQLMAHTAVTLPEQLRGYRNASLALLARFCLDNWGDLAQSSRSLFEGSIKRLTPEARQLVARSWAGQIPVRTKDFSTNDLYTMRGVAVVVTAILGSQYPQCIKPKVAKIVAELLMKILRKNSSQSAVAADLLGKGFGLWRPHLADPGDLVHQLFVLSISHVERPSHVQAAHQALMTIGAAEPSLFISVMGQEAVRRDHGAREHVAAVAAITALIRKHSAPLLHHLTELIDAILSALSPRIPAQREQCLVPCTEALRELVNKYSMVGFHQPTQRIAIGTTDALVVVYDLRQAIKWRVLQGHKQSVVAVEFAPGGQLIASYSDDNTVRVWQTMAHGLLGMLGMQGKCQHVFRVTDEDDGASPLVQKPVRIVWKSDACMELVRDRRTLGTFKV